jgi:hypothetical protein
MADLISAATINCDKIGAYAANFRPQWTARRGAETLDAPTAPPGHTRLEDLELGRYAGSTFHPAPPRPWSASLHGSQADAVQVAEAVTA